MTCRARVYGDQTICDKCGLTWDTNDPEPPACNPKDQRTKEARAIAAASELPSRPSCAIGGVFVIGGKFAACSHGGNGGKVCYFDAPCEHQN